MGKSSFKSKSFNTEEVVEQVHRDLCEPIRIVGYYGDNFFILFVDDYSRIMTVIYLKEESEAF